MNFVKKIQPLLGIFTFVAIALVFAKSKLEANKINTTVVMVANVLLLTISCFSVYLHSKAMQHKNPNVPLRTAMLSTIMKLFVLAVTVGIYLLTAKANKSVYAVFSSMLLYIIYSFTEVRINTKLKSNANS